MTQSQCSTCEVYSNCCLIKFHVMVNVSVILPWGQLLVLFYLVFDSDRGIWQGTSSQVSQLCNKLLVCPWSENSKLEGKSVVDGRSHHLRLSHGSPFVKKFLDNIKLFVLIFAKSTGWGVSDCCEANWVTPLFLVNSVFSYSQNREVQRGSCSLRLKAVSSF